MAWPSRGSEVVLARGECPSVHVPFQQLDGALVRVRLPGGVLPVQGARALAAAASGIGAGPVELTNRGNLQVRAVPWEGLGVMGRQLVEAGMVAADPSADERRNVLASPTAGVDPAELLDTRALVGAIAQHLAANGGDLSPKFGVLVDGGGAVHVRGRAQDIALGAVSRTDGMVGYEVRLAAPLPSAFAVDAPHPVVAPDEVLAVVDAVLDACRAFGRVSTYLDAVGPARAWAEIEARAPGSLSWWSGAELCAPPSASPAVVGARLQRDPTKVLVGAAAVLGRLDALTLARIADVADRVDVAELRVSPWRSIVLIDVPVDAAIEVVTACEELGLVCDPGHPTNAVVACAGSTGCAEARSDVQSDARRLIASLEGVPAERRPASVHVSGCGKGCARAEPAELSFVAVDPGTYEMYRGDARGQGYHPRFGERISGRWSWTDAIDVVTGGVGDEH